MSLHTHVPAAFQEVLRNKLYMSMASSGRASYPASCAQFPLLLQAATSANPLKRRCSWVYERSNPTQQANIRRCYDSGYQQYLAYKAFEDHLFNDVYPVLVRNGLRLAVFCALGFSQGVT